MIRKAIILISPLLLLGLVELAFRLGVWEPVATRYSHAGISISVKRQLLDPELQRVDFVTMGSSRPLYGLDHVKLAALAKDHGYVHANLSMAGSHWLTIGSLTEWLHQNHPELRGGIIALADQDFAFSGNGSYELGIVQPFRRLGDISMVNDHVPFDWHDINTYGVYSAMFEWRQDVQNLLAHPARVSSIMGNLRGDWNAGRLFANLDSQGNMCGQSYNIDAPCSNLRKSVDRTVDLEQQCNQIVTVGNGRPDFGSLLENRPLPDFMQRNRTQIQSRLRSMQWSIPPIVILMPVPEFTRANPKSSGLHRWALEILQPLVDTGEIHLIDATEFFADREFDECHYFFDFYHQNAKGRTTFSNWLLPQIEPLLYPNPR
jgi:lysophospholipase L1-like esterase